MRAPFALALIAAAALGLAACMQEPKLGDTVFVVLPDDDGTVGAVTVDDGQTVITLDQANAAAQVDEPGTLRTAAVTDEDIDTIFGRALAAQPIPPRDFILYFEFGTDTLTEESKEAFEAVFADVSRRVAPSIEVVGHTDTLAANEFNLRLSRERADNIRALLVERGVDPDAIEAVGRGEIDPLVETDDNVAEPRNRRVEITVR